MTAQHLALLVAAQALALISPGPAVLRLMQTSFTKTRAEALLFGLGLSVAAALWAVFAFAGVEALFRALPWLFTGLKLAGGAYLIFIAWKIWHGARAPLAPAPVGRVRNAVLSGMLTNFSNPKAALFFSAVFLTLLPPETSLGEKTLVVGTVLAVELIWYGSLSFLLANPKSRSYYLQAKHAIDRSCGVLLGALGLSIIVSR
ncbi:MAG: lysine transporter LysE [Rhodobacterales bacterium]|nr:MAG: lysine transporter LysE [Rhodobacterales bacterium]